ncbi:MAG: peptide chain release factor-like protein [Candidatus Omnitrophota bacterium]
MANVSSVKEKELRDKMRRLGVKEADLTESFMRAGGPGGQHVNKVSTCVYLRHGPTGLSVKCARERSQALNRFFARRILLKKIEDMVMGRASEERKRIEKIRRQKRKRSKRAKEKVLADKKKQSEKKVSRRSVKPED